MTTTYEHAEFKKEYPEAYKALIASVPEYAQLVLFADGSEHTGATFEVTVVTPEGMSVMALIRTYRNRRFNWQAERVTGEAGVALPSEAETELRKLLDSIGVGRIEAYYTAAADQDFFGTCAYDVAVTERKSDELKANAFRVTALSGSQFRSARWMAEIL